MAEIRTKNRQVRAIAYYLPQYHAIPENDKAWGKGFTEWVNVKKAKPLFEGHYQPKVPMNKNYYNLLDNQVMIEQAKLAQEYGVFGFCYYHYWFKDGKKLLEKPVENMLADDRIDIPFCLSWANENWTKNWDGGNREIIVEQDYGDETDWKKHLEYLVRFFKDPRYITLDGKPVLLIYKPDIIPNVSAMLRYWQKEAKNFGFSGFCFMIQNSGYYYSPLYHLGEFSYQIKFPPFYSIIRDNKNMKMLRVQQSIFNLLRCIGLDRVGEKTINWIKAHREPNRLINTEEVTVLDYKNTWEVMINSDNSKTMIEGAFVDWDNTARKRTGYLHKGATPELFMHYMKQIVAKLKKGEQEPIVFINAWNEWGEGAYLEPDEKYGLSYLKALKDAINEY